MLPFYVVKTVFTSKQLNEKRRKMSAWSLINSYCLSRTDVKENTRNDEYIFGNFIFSCVVHMGEISNAYKVLVGKPEGKTIWKGCAFLKWILRK
jgi:hypothetical protein